MTTCTTEQQYVSHAILCAARQGQRVLAANYRAVLSPTKGTFRIRQTGQEYVVEELRHGTWMIIESLPSLELADIAYHDYSRDGHDINWSLV